MEFPNTIIGLRQWMFDCEMIRFTDMNTISDFLYAFDTFSSDVMLQLKDPEKCRISEIINRLLTQESTFCRTYQAPPVILKNADIELVRVSPTEIVVRSDNCEYIYTISNIDISCKVLQVLGESDNDVSDLEGLVTAMESMTIPVGRQIDQEVPCKVVRDDTLVDPLSTELERQILDREVAAISETHPGDTPIGEVTSSEIRPTHYSTLRKEALHNTHPSTDISDDEGNQNVRIRYEPMNDRKRSIPCVPNVEFELPTLPWLVEPLIKSVVPHHIHTPDQLPDLNRQGLAVLVPTRHIASQVANAFADCISSSCFRTTRKSKLKIVIDKGYVTVVTDLHDIPDGVRILALRPIRLEEEVLGVKYTHRRINLSEKIQRIVLYSSICKSIPTLSYTDDVLSVLRRSNTIQFICV